ncbi:carbamate kinase [Natribacillus halophilus]|uniref:Carbamate kinase n=1 Tax=Natribacillus halophilus TaxID=549003 RepID=A0A1G8LY61_9BACI|nr:carbamate kinase [Natribacillus halophilus]SDI60641.1 carbamate kinase [Natribacillus halophilus]
MSKTVVVALGGNAIQQVDQEPTYENQLKKVEKSCQFLSQLVKQGYRLVITHGNGPQVGRLLQQNEEAQAVVPSMPLDVLNAQTQGFIGYMIEQSLLNELKKNHLEASVVSMITRVQVSKEDEEFLDPSKPVGSFFTEEEAKELQESKLWDMKKDANRGWRRVVSSPKPICILEAEAIRELSENNNIVVAGGGGGIPVVRNDSGIDTGIEAVIDKDRSGCKLAEDIDADVFMILTDVNHVYVNYGKPNEKALRNLSIEELEAYIKNGHFSKGSMGPKVEAALQFAKTGGTSIICALDQAEEALQGKTGTIVKPVEKRVTVS